MSKTIVKAIRPTLTYLEPDKYDEFNQYATSTEITKSVGMNRMRKMMREHVKSKRKDL